ncbi:MAG TPA: mechanosensitive ion channel domain-containing protein [Rhodanobacteraceae bacterium]|nr:mechanosensitive ion channel domain-containing protein [Rhodanobacteraceae bacterium]
MHTLARVFSQPWSRLAVIAVLALIAAMIVFRVLRFMARRLLRADDVLAIVLARCEQPFELALPLLALQFALATAKASTKNGVWLNALHHAVTIALICALTWLGVRAISGIERAVALRHPSDIEDNLRARSVQTQARVLSRTAMFLIGLLGIATVLMTFPSVRQFGASLLASAGVAGIVIGFAARPVLTNLLAGLQIALAQPIRLDDVLIVENEWGRVEEITGTYVVLRIWDERRLVIPLQWFVENPFQNWTRRSAQIIGTVLLWVDYAMPLPPLREELERIVHAAPEWDGRTCVLQVTDADPHAMQVRILVSSKDSGRSWDLRCKVREGLIDFLQRDYPQYLPKLRIDPEPGDRKGRIAPP